jgi:NTE family protein
MSKIGLVLSGGGARGAYEVGALSVLLPWLHREQGERPEVIVGTSVGALNAAFLGATANQDPARQLEEGCHRWREIGYRDVLEPLLSGAELTKVARLLASFLFPAITPYSLLDPSPLATTLPRLIDFPAINRNIVDSTLHACAVVATAAYTNRSVVFHDGGPDPIPSDERRAIDYVATALSAEHVRASAAIPVVFPGVEVQAGEWYFDGGTRLNTPIKPALVLGAERVIVLGLNSLASAPSAPQRPDLFDGATQLVQGLLVDPVARDVETLATINELLMDGGVSPTDQREVVPYVFVAPQTPNAIGEIARRVYRDHYTGLRGWWRSRDLTLLGRFVGAGKSSTRGELFSYLFFAGDFATRLIELGRRDAERWVEQRHDDGAWQLRRLPR